MVRTSSTSVSTMAAVVCATPALLTQRSTEPSSATALSQSPWTGDRVGDVGRRARRPGPSDPRSATAASTVSCLRPLTTTAWPRLASSAASARPMPWVEPVMTTFLVHDVAPGSNGPGEDEPGLAGDGLVDHPALGVEGDAGPGGLEPGQQVAGPGDLVVARGEDLVGDHDLGRVDAGPADEARAGPGPRSRSRNASRSRKFVDTGAIGGAMPGGGRGQHDRGPDVQQLELVGPERDAEVGAQVGLADLEPLHPRGGGELARPAAPRRRSRGAVRRAPPSPRDDEQPVERRPARLAVSVLATTTPVSAGASATARTSASRSGPGVDPDPDPDVEVGRSCSQTRTAWRAASLPAAGTASSRSTISSSAPRSSALVSLSGASPGT